MAYARHPRVTPPTLEHALSRQAAQFSVVTPTATVGEALQQLLANSADALVVRDDQDLRGIFSNHDFARFAAQGGSITQPVRDAMSACAARAAPQDPVEEWLAKAKGSGEFFLPVIADGQLLGLLTRADLLAESDAHHRRVFQEMVLDERIMFRRGTYSC